MKIHFYFYEYNFITDNSNYDFTMLAYFNIYKKDTKFKLIKFNIYLKNI